MTRGLRRLGAGRDARKLWFLVAEVGSAVRAVSAFSPPLREPDRVRVEVHEQQLREDGSIGKLATRAGTFPPRVALRAASCGYTGPHSNVRPCSISAAIALSPIDVTVSRRSPRSAFRFPSHSASRHSSSCGSFWYAPRSSSGPGGAATSTFGRDRGLRPTERSRGESNENVPRCCVAIRHYVLMPASSHGRPTSANDRIV